MINKEEKDVLTVRKKSLALKNFFCHDKQSDLCFKLYNLKLKKNNINIKISCQSTLCAGLQLSA